MNQNEDGYNLLKYKAWNFKDFSYVYENTEDPSKVKRYFVQFVKNSRQTINTNSKNLKGKGKMQYMVTLKYCC